MTDVKTIPTRRNVSRPGVMPDATLPDPPSVAPAAPSARGAADPSPSKPARPETLAEAYPYLLMPFPQRFIELKPTALTKDRSRALASPYADPRVYFARLDKICGPENWSTELVFSERGCCCRLTIFGVTKTAGGDYPIDRADENPATSAEAQAFKRACSAFGLGRYLYALPMVWGEYDSDKRQIVNPAGIVAQMYASLPKNGDE